MHWWQRIGKVWQDCREASLQLVFPPACAYCGGAILDPAPSPRSRLWWCDVCLQQLIHLGHPLCSRCGSELPRAVTNDRDCPRCMRETMRWDRLVTLGPYRGHLRHTVIRMKHASEHGLTVAMGTLLAEHLRQQLGDQLPEGVVPMPMHWMRRAVRGINAPEILAETIARQLSIPCDRHLLHVQRRTRKQSLLPPTERRKNMHQALNMPPQVDLAGYHLLLVDDIVTTGASAHEAVRNLRSAGVRRVTVAAVARALPPP